jgi:hypothetical protein
VLRASSPALSFGMSVAASNLEIQRHVNSEAGDVDAEGCLHLFPVLQEAGAVIAVDLDDVLSQTNAVVAECTFPMDHYIISSCNLRFSIYCRAQ